MPLANKSPRIMPSCIYIVYIYVLYIIIIYKFRIIVSVYYNIIIIISLLL